jgi:hypothetical protein
VSDETNDKPDPLDRAIAAAIAAGRAPRGLPRETPGDPTDDQILRVVEGWASDAERAAVDASPLAAARAEIVAAALAEATPAAPSAAMRAARYVFAVARDTLTFLRGATQPVAAPELAWATRSSPTAGGERLTELRHRFGDLDAQVRVEHVTRKTQTVDLEVRLVDQERRPAGAGRITLRRGGLALDSVPLDAAGAALFTGLAPASYELELRATGQIVGVMVLEFLPG